MHCAIKQLLLFVDVDNLITNLYQLLLEARAEINYNNNIITELAEILSESVDSISRDDPDMPYI